MRRGFPPAPDCTFGVYMMHPLLISTAERALTPLDISALLPPLLCAALVFLASLVCTRIIRAVPLLKRIV